jgi:hypothetical protein
MILQEKTDDYMRCLHRHINSSTKEGGEGESTLFL